MILSILRMLVQPERRRDLLETVKGMLEPARVERGCLSFRLYEDVENRNAFVLLEEWATQEDLERHISKDNQRRLLALMDLLSEQPELRFNTVSHTAGMDLIEEVLNDIKEVKMEKNKILEESQKMEAIDK
ncbi:MAG: putative quinol monooxygenase [Dissulfurispiraceae bacterium]